MMAIVIFIYGAALLNTALADPTVPLTMKIMPAKLLANIVGYPLSDKVEAAFIELSPDQIKELVTIVYANAENSLYEMETMLKSTAAKNGAKMKAAVDSIIAESTRMTDQFELILREQLEPLSVEAKWAGEEIIWVIRDKASGAAAKEHRMQGVLARLVRPKTKELLLKTFTEANVAAFVNMITDQLKSRERKDLVVPAPAAEEADKTSWPNLSWLGPRKNSEMVQQEAKKARNENPWMTRESAATVADNLRNTLRTKIEPNTEDAALLEPFIEAISAQREKQTEQFEKLLMNLLKLLPTAAKKAGIEIVAVIRDHTTTTTEKEKKAQDIIAKLELNTKAELLKAWGITA